MNFTFKKLPLSVKLMLIGIIPIVFLIYLSYELYNEKMLRVKLIGDYIEQIHESGNISSLIDELQKERRRSYQYILEQKGYNNIILQRPHTDSAIQRLERIDNLAIINFTQYTFLDRLPKIRNAIDSSKGYSADSVMQFYTNAVFRLTTLYSTPPSNTYLQPVYRDLIAQKILSEMITFLGIIRANIYNALLTRKDMLETLNSTVSSHDVYKTYEKEFFIKASPASIEIYKNSKDTSALKPTISYIDSLFKNLNFDSSYSADNWWQISTEGLKDLKKQQTDLWSKVEANMNNIYKKEKSKGNKTLAFILVAILLVLTFVIYTTKVITQMLVELKVGAQKISMGKTGLQFHNMPNDVMGSLTQSILEIDKNNIQLAQAANAIGKGNFDVSVQPRSDEDLLGNSIQAMKEDLHQLTMQKDKIQEDTLELMRKKDDFLSIASHELKTPVTSLKAYTQILQMDSIDAKDTRRELMFTKMDMQIDKLTSLINNLLDTTKLQNGELVYNKTIFQLNDLLSEIIEEMQMAATSHEIIVKDNIAFPVYADRERIGQVLSNLISNAIKYCPDCKRIIVSLKRKGNEAICSVQDYGYGIVNEQKDKIFERFYRITGNNLHTYPGLGLGLFIAKEIIERHNGKIWLESEPGKGSIFYFTLPLQTGV